jgi:hypothetical protein
MAALQAPSIDQLDGHALPPAKQLGRLTDALRFFVQARYLSAASAPIASAIALPFLTVAVLVLTGVAKLPAYPTLPAVVTIVAVAAPIINLHATRTNSNTLSKSRSILDK